MDFGDSPEEAAFRLRLREWLQGNNPHLPASSISDDYWAGQAAWHQALYDAGFFGMSWPPEIAGQGLPGVYEVIVDSELAAAGAPPRPSVGFLVEGSTYSPGTRSGPATRTRPTGASSWPVPIRTFPGTVAFPPLPCRCISPASPSGR